MRLTIAIEGGDGAGKTSLCSALLSSSLAVPYTRERRSFQGGHVLGEIMKQLSAEALITPTLVSALSWMSAAMTAEHASECELCFYDRHKLSMELFDALTGVPASLTAHHAKLIKDPDILIYLDVSPELALERVLERKGGVSFLETEYKFLSGRENLRYKTLFETGEMDSRLASASFLNVRTREREWALKSLENNPTAIILDASAAADVLVDRATQAVGTGIIKYGLNSA